MKSVLPAPESVVQMLKTMTMAEIGALYGVTRQNVSAWIRSHGYSCPLRLSACVRRNQGAITEALVNGQSMTDVARDIGVHRETIAAFARRRGIQPRHGNCTAERPGCPRCEIHPYARGWCRPCYDYARRHDLLEKR